MADQSGNGKAGKKGPSGRSYRNATGLTRQPKKMRGRKVSSQRWLTRQLNDPFVAEAKSRGFRSRAALKLEQMDDRYQLLKPGMAIVDLGCAPGGWLQVASIRTKLGTGSARLVGIDLLETEGVVGADIFTGDFEQITIKKHFL
ncbi:MAG: SAM-dependent methyltransferase, partial [Candidatus Puniceispirillaceae bacterium]